MDGFNGGVACSLKGRDLTSRPRQTESEFLKEMDMRLRVCGSKGLKDSFGVLLFWWAISATDTDVDGADDLNDPFPNCPATF